MPIYGNPALARAALHGFVVPLGNPALMANTSEVVHAFVFGGATHPIPVLHCAPKQLSKPDAEDRNMLSHLAVKKING